MIDSSTLTQVASIIAGFGAAALVFRIQRELEMQKEGEANWIAFTDWLLIIATFFCLVFAIVPLMLFTKPPMQVITFVRGICAASALMVGGWVFGILAHYRLILGKNRSGPRTNPEPSETVIVIFTFSISFVIFIVTQIS